MLGWELEMALFDWSDTLSTGIPSIDRQHRTLVDVLNELHDGILAGRGQATLTETFARLMQYTEDHFAYEEGLLRDAGYGELEAHIAFHRGLSARVVELKREFEGGNAGISLELLEFLRDWLRQHIVGTDKRYAPWLQARGVT